MPILPVKIPALWLHLTTRLCLIAAFLLMLMGWAARKNENSPVLPIETSNTDLQLVQLYQQTNGLWTDEQQETLNQILTARHEYELVARRLPFSQSPSIPVLWVAAQQQRDEKNWQGLILTLNTILTVNPTHGEANLWLALLTLPQSQGMAYLQTASSTAHPRQSLAAALLGVVSVEGYQPFDVAIRLVEVGEWVFAERFLTEQIEQNSLDARAFAYRGFVRDNMGEDGLADIQQALALEPTQWLGFYMLGMHERLNGNTADSLTAFQDAYVFAPENPALAAEVATGFQLMGNFEQADEWYRLAVSLAPEDVRFASLQAAFYAENSYLLDGRGMEVILATAEKYPDDAHVQASLGHAYFQLGQLAEANSVLQTALLLAPNDPRTRYFLGNVAERQNERGLAIEHYRVVVQTENPYADLARTALGRLS